jgi:hypothetical protein
MTLRALIRRRADNQFDTATTMTVATLATHEGVRCPTVATVATVATVTVMPVSETIPGADPWADCAEALLYGALHQCRACRHFAGTVPPGQSGLGVHDAGWCRQFSVAAHPLVPFVCDGYMAALPMRVGL